MIIRTYLDWSRNASIEDRALAVGILAELYLNGDLSDEDKRHAEAALTLVLDDSALLVRKTLAEILAGADRVPRHIIIGLLQDHDEIAQLVIANSPLLRDSELIHCLISENPLIHLAVAERNRVSLALSEEIAAKGDVSAIIALLENAGAEIALTSLQKMLERFPNDGALREILINRSDLPVEIRMSLVDAATKQLVGLAKERGWFSPQRAARVEVETVETGSLSVARDIPEHDMVELAVRLRRAGQLTVQLLLRSLLSGDTRLFTASLADLAGVSIEKASGFVHGRSISGFRALYRKAKMPDSTMPAFEAALEAWHQLGQGLAMTNSRLSLRMVEHVLTSTAVFDQADETGLLALLSRYQAEAAREEAQAHISSMLAQNNAELDQANDASTLTLQADDIDRQLSEALQLEFYKAA
jgi:uncharacterized protein (DUF2336 family)